jgi:GNAT superfamily N-acetyltransferase
LVGRPGAEQQAAALALGYRRGPSAARERLQRCVGRLAEAGLDANGMIGDADPLQAAADALRLFDASLIVIATHPEQRSNWLARRVVERIRERFGLPVVHVVVDPKRQIEYIRKREETPGPLLTAA